jgi:hypothetical protein
MDYWKRCQLLNSEKESNSKREKSNKRPKEKDKKTYTTKIKRLNLLSIPLPKLKRPEIREKLKTTEKELINYTNNKKWNENVRK